MSQRGEFVSGMNVFDARTIFADLAPVVLYNEALSRHTTMRIGGPADALAIPETIEQVEALVHTAKSRGVPIFILGRGSNLLVRDGGIRGLVIKLGDAFSKLTVEGRELTVFAGRTIVSTAHVAMKNGLAGLEFAAGIPGTVGGAVVMNAGAHGGEMKDVIRAVQVLTSNGLIETRSVEALQFGYRTSSLRDSGDVVLGAVFRLAPGDTAEMQQKVKAWNVRRQATQPLSYPSCGSVFRNPAGDFAARLIEAAGLKGERIGGAMISELHANFIVNLGGASAADVISLMTCARARVRDEFGVELVPEVRVVGEDGARG